MTCLLSVVWPADDDDDDDEAELLRELQRIKSERAKEADERARAAFLFVFAFFLRACRLASCTPSSCVRSGLKLARGTAAVSCWSASQEAAKTAEEQQVRNENYMRGNPLLQGASSDNFGIQKRCAEGCRRARTRCWGGEESSLGVVSLCAGPSCG